MDRQSLALLIPILALSIPVAAIVFNGLVKLAKAKAGGAGALDDRALARLAELEGQLDELRRELPDTQERLDLTERQLARLRDDPRRP
ncbi:MAG: hypothetical protein ACREL9_12410 [Gemmatimonadales bacterium]